MNTNPNRPAVRVRWDRLPAAILAGIVVFAAIWTAGAFVVDVPEPTVIVSVGVLIVYLLVRAWQVTRGRGGE